MAAAVTTPSPSLPPFSARVSFGATPSQPSVAANGVASVPAAGDLATICVEPRYWDYEAFQPSLETERFLAHDLDVSRLNSIYGCLWWAGRRCPPRALHRLKMLGRTFAVTEQADLHLVWSQERFFLKPLPEFLLNHAFWTTKICPDPVLDESARGFLLSYVWLVRHVSDFRIAQAEGLLPTDLKWPQWSCFVASVWDTMNSDPRPVSRRYNYGELRLSRLQQIYRFYCGHLLTGYHYSYSSYSGFFRREFAWLVVTFAYISIVLSAMQVGLTTTQLRDNVDFNRGSYGFVVLATVFPAVIMAVALVMWAGLWVYHVATTLSHHVPVRRREKREERGHQTQEKDQQQNRPEP